MFLLPARTAPTPASRTLFRFCVIPSLFVLASCNGEKTVIDTGDEGGEAETVTSDADLAWDSLSLESSVTLSGGFASGAGFYAVGEDGEVYVRSDGEWRQEGVNADEPLNGIWGVRTNDINYAIAVGDGGLVARLDDAGWTDSQELNTANMEAITSVDGTTFIAVGWGGAYIYSDSVWAFQNMEGNAQFNDVWSDGTTTVAVGQDGLIATSNPDGTWSLENLPSRIALHGVSGTGRDNIWVTGEDGTVLHNVGSGWEALEVGTNTTLWSVLSLTPDATYIVGNSGVAIRHDGTDYVNLDTGVDNNLYDISSSQGGVIWAVGNRGATLRLRNGY